MVEALYRVLCFCRGVAGGGKTDAYVCEESRDLHESIPTPLSTVYGICPYVAAAAYAKLRGI